MTVDLKTIIWSRKPEKNRAQLTARADTALICASDIAGKGRPVFVADAGMVAGMLARTQNFRKQQLKDLLNDALDYLRASKHGLSVLTNNKADFDLLQQIAPGGHLIFI